MVLSFLILSAQPEKSRYFNIPLIDLDDESGMQDSTGSGSRTIKKIGTPPIPDWSFYLTVH